MISKLSGVFVILLVSAQCWALGGPPILTDDPGTPGSGNWEVNVAVTSESSSSRSRLEAPLADINYGVGERIQLKYEVPFVISKNRDDPTSVNGIDHSMGGIKYRFLDQEKAGFAMSTYPQVAFRSPMKSGIQDSEHATGTEGFIPVEIQETRGLWEFNQEVGYHLVYGEMNQAFYGGAITYTVRDGFALLTELHGSFNRDLSDDELVMNVGGEYELAKSLNLLVSTGRSFRDYDQSPSRILTYLGMQFRM